MLLLHAKKIVAAARPYISGVRASSAHSPLYPFLPHTDRDTQRFAAVLVMHELAVGAPEEFDEVILQTSEALTFMERLFAAIFDAKVRDMAALTTPPPRHSKAFPSLSPCHARVHSTSYTLYAFQVTTREPAVALFAQTLSICSQRDANTRNTLYQAIYESIQQGLKRNKEEMWVSTVPRVFVLVPLFIMRSSHEHFPPVQRPWLPHGAP